MKRVLTALLLIPAVVFINFRAPRLAVWALLAVVSLLALREFFALAEKLGFHPYRITGYGAGALLVLSSGLPEGARVLTRTEPGLREGRRASTSEDGRK